MTCRQSESWELALLREARRRARRCRAGVRPGTAEARIKIDTERVVGQVDARLFGNFAEHLGRCIYGGIYDEGSPLADADGFPQGRYRRREGMNVSLLRWPGGNFVSGYHWEDGIGQGEAARAPR